MQQASPQGQKDKLRFIIFLVLFCLLTGVLGLIFWSLISELQKPQFQEAFSAWVSGLGLKGVFVLLGLQILQVVVSVIPGGPVQIIAGAAYGVWGGLFIIISGCTAATMLVFFMVRKFGLPLVKRFIGASALETWGFLASEKKTALVTFILFLIPGVPKDTLTYLAPLSRLSLVQFTMISIIARFPAMLSSTVMGDAAIQGNRVLFSAVFGITFLAGILGIQFKDRIARKAGG